jgi:hypothetical protein
LAFFFAFYLRAHHCANCTSSGQAWSTSTPLAAIPWPARWVSPCLMSYGTYPLNQTF